MNLDFIRKKFPILDEGIFLNHAATAPVSSGTIEAMKSLCDQMREPLGKHFYPWLGIMEETRRELAELLHVSPAEIAFTQNTSSSLSIIAGSIAFKPGDRILIPRDEFPSNRYVWQNLSHLGVNCTFFDIENDRPLIETLEKFDLSNVKLITLSLVSYLSGKKHDIKAFGDFCHRQNILSCVDAIQAVGTMSIDLSDTKIDFLAGGAQKWLLGPIGCGYFYIRKELIKHARSPLVGWTSMRYPENFDVMELDFADEATRFEPGLPAITSIGGFNHSLRELKNIGWDAIYNRIASNARYLHEGLREVKGLSLMIEDPSQLGPIVTAVLPKELNPKKLNARLEKTGITVTTRNHILRVSPHFYNTSNELDPFLEAIDGQIHDQRLFFPKILPEKRETEFWILLNGATGTLGREIALYLAEKGYHVTGIGQNEKTLKGLEKECLERFGTKFEPMPLDVTDAQQISAFFSHQKKAYVGLINSSGVVDPSLFEAMDPKKLTEMFQVNFFAPAQFLQHFLSKHSVQGRIGILNIVSASGRLGYPLLGGYGASHAALWNLSESLQRECLKRDLNITTFVSPPMHSPMQKKIGRTSLRYFRMKGTFDYAHAEEVARDAIDAFLANKGLVISKKNRLLLLLNALSPKFLNRKLKKIWYL